MTRTLATKITLSALLALSATGCVESQRGTYAPVNSEPLTIDPAMQQREWEPTPALYANGDTVSWGTGFAYEPTGDDERYYYLTDTGTFFVNFVTMPFTFFREGTNVRYQGAVVPPTYTANPPLPASPVTETSYQPTTQPAS